MPAGKNCAPAGALYIIVPAHVLFAGIAGDVVHIVRIVPVTDAVIVAPNSWCPAATKSMIPPLGTVNVALAVMLPLAVFVPLVFVNVRLLV